MNKCLSELEQGLNLYLMLDEPQDKAQDTQYLINHIKNSLFLFPNKSFPCELAMCTISSEKKRSALYVLTCTHLTHTQAYSLIKCCSHCQCKRAVSLAYN